MKVFLGGTCAESKWREKLIPLLKCEYFNPVVEDWTPECQKIEEEQKKIIENEFTKQTDDERKQLLEAYQKIYDDYHRTLEGDNT